jgi:hypothetical protein
MNSKKICVLLTGGWGNIVFIIWFAVLALTYKDQGTEDQKPV